MFLFYIHYKMHIEKYILLCEFNIVSLQKQISNNSSNPIKL